MHVTQHQSVTKTTRLRSCSEVVHLARVHIRVIVLVVDVVCLWLVLSALVFFLLYLYRFRSQFSVVGGILFASFASLTVHQEVVDFVDKILLLERDEVLLAAIRSFHSICVYFFGHK